MEKDIQLFVSVDKQGKILDAQMGKGIVMADPSFPYVFMITKDTAAQLAQDTSNFRIKIVDFEPELIELTDTSIG